MLLGLLNSTGVIKALQRNGNVLPYIFSGRLAFVSGKRFLVLAVVGRLNRGRRDVIRLRSPGTGGVLGTSRCNRREEILVMWQGVGAGEMAQWVKCLLHNRY